MPGLVGQRLLFQAQTWDGGGGKGQGGAQRTGCSGRRAEGRRKEQKAGGRSRAEQNRHLVSWLLVLLWGWDLVESVELDSE